MPTPTLLIHGGAGHIGPTMQARSDDLHTGVAAALQAGNAAFHKPTEHPTRALAAVLAAVVAMENHPLFNAGLGSVLCRDGSVECCASVMCGATGRVGAVACVSRVKNPVLAAARVLGHQHNLIVGPSAETLAREANLAMVESDGLVVPARRAQWERYRDADHVIDSPAIPNADFDGEDDASKGTVGAVAIDADGNLAAATSTGGLVNQLPGRIGDSPLVGCGTWAENGLLALSATGDGDAFARVVFARRVADRIQLAGLSPREAAEAALQEVEKEGGKGGCILVTAEGEILAPHSSVNMVHGWVVGEVVETRLETG